MNEREGAAGDHPTDLKLSDEDTELSPDETVAVERERDRLKAFVSKLSFDEIKNGGWFAKLLTLSLATYTNKVDWKYFQDKYQGVPPRTQSLTSGLRWRQDTRP